MRKTIAVDLSMFEGKKRKCISKAVQQRMFGWGYGWYEDGKTEDCIDKPYLYMCNDSYVTYSDSPIPWRFPEYINYTAEEFLSLVADPLKVVALEVGKPYINNATGSVVVLLRHEGVRIFTGVKIYSRYAKDESLWIERQYSKQLFAPLDPSRIKIEVLP